LPEDLDLDAILQNLKCENVVTPMQLRANNILSDIDRDKLVHFVKIIYSKIMLFRESLNIDASNMAPVSAQKLTEFYSKMHIYQTSAEYRMSCLSFFNN